MVTDKALVDLFVGIVYATTAREDGSDVSAAVAQAVDEVLVASAEFHVAL
jgi:hypothetical protein